MHRRALFQLLLTVTLAGCAIMSHASLPSTGSLTCEWAPESAELGGRPFPVESFRDATLHLTAESCDFAGDTGTYRVLDAAEPAAMDIHGQAGPNAGRTILARYALMGDRLSIAYQLGAGERPTGLASPAGSQLLLIHYGRVT